MMELHSRQDSNPIGIYGKIPSQGDFINQNLPRVFLDTWDHWLQQAILASQEVLGDSWLEYFLISPVWRFVLPKGLIGQGSWAGIMLPSVDSVGRYYPLTLVAPVPEHVGAFEYLTNADKWFQSLEDVAITTLEKGFNVAELVQALDQNEFELAFPTEQVLPLKAERQLQHVLPLNSTDQALTNVMPLLCDGLLKSQDSGFSLWWTKGGEHVEPALLFSEQLPRPTSYTAMLNGQWNNWHWPNLLQFVGG